jgi:hypothetical protein
MSSWDIYLAQHSPAKRIGTDEAVDNNAAIEEAAELFKANDSRKLIAVQTAIGPKAARSAISSILISF